jgi:pimeloyl-ACP methyl ester carboxylesterase
VPRTIRLLLAAATVAVTAGCTLPVFAPGSGGGAPAGGRAVPGAQAAWKPCPQVPTRMVGRPAKGMTYDCASVTVPRDWHAPQAGGTYDVRLIRVRSQTQHDRIGSLLVDPGGPGASGIELAVYRSYGQALGGFPTAVTDRFDLVGFDPRGVGASDPVRCISAADQDATFAAEPDPVSQRDFDATAALTRRIAQGCAARYGDQLGSFATEQAARDMDAIRAAVGDQKLSYLGYSYGTLLGATYAQQFPKNVRALVLDGAVDPTKDIVASSEEQAVGFERAFTDFAAWCRRTPASCPIGHDARAAVNAALARARTAPVRNHDGRLATSGWVFTGVFSSLYSQSDWPDLAKSLDALRHGQSRGIFQLADNYAQRNPDGSYSNLFDAFLAVSCADTANPPSVQRIRLLQGEWRRKYPLFGASLAVGMLPCTYWPAKHDPYPAGPAAGAPPIVVVGTTGDPATPYESTAKLAAMLGTGHVLTWEGEGHTAYPTTACIRDAVDAYLVDLTVPKDGLRCPAR